MFSLVKGARKAPPTNLADLNDGPITVDEARLAAWAVALGDFRPTTDPPRQRRPHPGMLPDVDWANAVPMPRRRSLLRLIAGALAARMVPLASLGDNGPRPIGEPTSRAA